MMQLVGRFVLGCILAVHVLADVATEKPNTSASDKLAVTTETIPVVEIVTESLNKTSPEIAKRVALPEIPTNPNQNTKIFPNPFGEKEKEREIVVINNQSPTEGSHHADHGNHDHHGYHDHHYDHDYHHHPPPPRPPPPHHHDHHHHHPPPPPHHHQQYPHQQYPPQPYPGQQYPHQPYPVPGYYPHHYPLPYSQAIAQPYATAGTIQSASYPYYGPPIYYHQAAMKPSAPVIQTSTTPNIQSLPKPTDLINQGTEYLWNLFGRLGAVTHDNHEVIVIHPKPVTPAPAMQLLPSAWYPDKTKKVLDNDCNNKKE